MASLLSHCAAPPQQPVQTLNAKQHPIPAWERHYTELKNLHAWHAKGRLAASNSKEGGSAAFDWQQEHLNYQIKFVGAFGAGSAILVGTPHLVTLQDSQGKFKQAQSPEVLMNHLAGWHIPLTGLQYWVKGMPMPDQPTKTLDVDTEGRLIHLAQLGWDIEYSAYSPTQTISLPGKINLVNNQLKVKLVIKQWHI
ncbi:MAG: lipoprotein insertase outer membrane protein LolB [Gammaproteobacteria bacterium]